MLKKRISKIALIVASIFFIQPYLSVVATLTVSATTTVAITDVVNQTAMSQAGITISQTATKLSTDQVEVITTLVSEKPLAELMVKQTVSDQFSVLRETIDVKADDGTQSFSQGVDIPITLSSEPITTLVESESPSFAIGGSGQNVILYGKSLAADTIYTVITRYDLAIGAVSGETLLVAPATLDYRLYESGDLPTVLDISIVTPKVVISDVVPPVETPEVVPPVETPEVVPPVETPEVVPPVETPEVVPPVETPEVVPPVETPEVVPPVETPPIIVEAQPTVTSAFRELPSTLEFIGPMAVEMPATVNLTKTATVLPDGLTEIALQIVGNVEDVPGQEVRIVLPVDVTQDNKRLEDMKAILTTFVTTIKDADPRNIIAINIIGYSNNTNNSTGNFEKDKTILLNTIANLQTDNTKNGFNLNLSDAYRFAGTQLCTGNQAVPSILGYLINFIGSTPNVNAPNKTPAEEAMAIKLAYTELLAKEGDTNCSKVADISVYSLGLLETNQDRVTGTVGDGVPDYQELQMLLPYLQNIVPDNASDPDTNPQNEYMEAFYDGSPKMDQKSNLEIVFADIAEFIAGQAYDIIGYNTILTDIISKYFNVYETPTYVGNTQYWEVTGQSEIKIVTHSDDTEPCTASPILCDKFVVDLGAIPENTGQFTTVNGVQVPVKNIVTFKFKVEPRDPYYGTASLADIQNPNIVIPDSQKVPTNYGDAILNYIDPVTFQPGQSTAMSPLVPLPFVEGTVTVMKDVNNIVTDQKFSVLIEGVGETNNQIYGFDVSEIASETMSFYMKDSSTDITPNTDYSKNYVTIGQFDIREIVLQNYGLVSIEYHYGDNNWTLYSGENPFVIDKEHRAVYIRITNELTNTKYWYDRAEAENMFPFTYAIPIAIHFSKEEKEIA